jgi:hypothetical protein
MTQGFARNGFIDKSIRYNLYHADVVGLGRDKLSSAVFSGVFDSNAALSKRRLRSTESDRLEKGLYPISFSIRSLPPSSSHG